MDTQSRLDCFKKPDEQAGSQSVRFRLKLGLVSVGAIVLKEPARQVDGGRETEKERDGRHALLGRVGNLLIPATYKHRRRH